MIDKAGKKRITIKEIFEHPWVKKFKFKIYSSNDCIYDKILKEKEIILMKSKDLRLFW